MTPRASRIGVISDTHGLLREEATAALRDSELIIHAGDIGTPEILAALERIAPVHAVRGNNDRAPWAVPLPERRVVEVNGTRIYLIHDLGELARDGGAEGCQVVIAGHSHRPRLERRDGVLYVNPGSAGPRRFKLPVSVARMAIGPHGVSAEIVELAI